MDTKEEGMKERKEDDKKGEEGKEGREKDGIFS
jgi:hypothetical protein